MRWLLIAAVVAACGGGGKKQETTPEGPDPSLTTEPDTSENDAAAATMFKPETMDQINRLLQRKAPAVSRCLTMVVDNKELPKNSRGKMTLGIAIAPSGAADRVKVIKSTFESQSLDDCVIAKVKEIPFPQLPKTYETTFTYGLEAIQ